jgi:hypothetical protein
MPTMIKSMQAAIPPKIILEETSVRDRTARLRGRSVGVGKGVGVNVMVGSRVA